MVLSVNIVIKSMEALSWDCCGGWDTGTGTETAAYSLDLGMLLLHGMLFTEKHSFCQDYMGIFISPRSGDITQYAVEN